MIRIMNESSFTLRNRVRNRKESDNVILTVILYSADRKCRIVNKAEITKDSFDVLGNNVFSIIMDIINTEISMHSNETHIIGLYVDYVHSHYRYVG